MYLGHLVSENIWEFIWVYHGIPPHSVLFPGEHHDYLIGIAIDFGTSHVQTKLKIRTSLSEGS